MSDIEEFHTRIVSALERAGRALDQIGAGSGGGDSAALADELEAERVANAQLEERVRAIKEKQETTVARLESEVAELRAVLETRDEALARMKAVNDNLRASNQALREANAAGLADADLVNASLASELDGVRAQRATDRAEIDEILATLDPILKEA